MSVVRKKLYFLAEFRLATSAGIAAAGRVFPCTQFRTDTKSYVGDIYGGVLADLPPLTNGSPIETKRRNDVSAWIRTISVGDETTASSTQSQKWQIDFVDATTIASGATILQTSGMLAFGDPFGTAQAGIGIDGVTPVMTRHFGVRVKRHGSGLATGTVMLYVQRQHSIEV